MVNRFSFRTRLPYEI